MPIGACADCGKRYRIQESARGLRCKECGGPVTAEMPAGDSEPVQTCPACEATSAASASFCEQCGEPFAPTGERSRGDAVEQRLLGSELRRAFQRVQSVRWVFGFNAFLYAMACLVLLFAREEDIPRGPLTTAMTIVFGLLSAALIVGSFQVLSRPFGWSVAIAPIATLTAIFSTSVWTVVGAVSAWLALGSAASARKLLARIEGPIRISQKYIAVQGRIERYRTDRARPGAATTRAREQDRGRRSSARKKALVFGAGTIGGVVLIVLVVIQLSKPPEFEPHAKAFADTWNEPSQSADEAARRLAELFQDNETKMSQSIRRRFSRYGWEEQRPRLGDPEIRQRSDDRAWAEFPLIGVTITEKLETSWGLEGGEWRLRAIRYPKDLPRVDDR